MPAWLNRRRLGAVLGVVVVVAGLITWAVWPAVGIDVEERMVTVSESPRVQLDTSVFVPEGVSAQDPAPAVILAHGFGGTKESVRGDAEFLAAEGYVVLTYTARGFGASGGQIGLNAPDAEVADASVLIDELAQRDDVRRDAEDDPRVGIAGGSYGGALALLAAGYDDRVDAIVPMITWNSLVTAFFPQSAGEPAAGTPAAGPAPSETPPGVFKKLWAGLFFGTGNPLVASALTATDDDDEGGSGAGSGGGAASGDGAGEGGSSSDGAQSGPDAGAGAGAGASVDPQTLTCGRFRPELCALYAHAATTGTLSDTGRALLQASSPASVLHQIEAPTLLIQGASDTLFPLSEADANARGIAAAGTPVKVAWYPGGHDDPGDDDDTEYLRELTLGWFGQHLKGGEPASSAGFEFSQQIGLSTQNARPTSRISEAEEYPGLDGGQTEQASLPLSGPDQPVASPPGGNPASLSSVPGVSGLAGGLGVAIDPPGQAAYFQSEPLEQAAQLTGSPTVRIRVASPTGEATLFAKLYDVDPSGAPQLPHGLVAPIKLTGLAPTLDEAEPIEVTLPPVAHRFEAGHTVRLAVATSDQAYWMPNEPKAYQIGLATADEPLRLPQVDGVPVDSELSPWVPFFAVVGGLLVVGVVVGLVWRRRVRARDISTVDGDLVDVPLVMTGLRKAYSNGFVAVKELSFRVERNQVVGLLGPNGAGKTTALRMLMGLIRPTRGEIRVFGHEVVAGAPVLSRLGCFVEGVGFLPHLSGLDNLKLYWAATGRPEADAHLDEALEIAGLGAAVHRKVRTYSQGMRQRLAVAQAMLGLPDVLVLDEPTNGLDPPQIAEMREVLRDYARDGRTVLVSSHQLAEVEQTCTHVVVMDRGELVAQGPVDEIIGVGTSVLFGVDDPEAAETLLRSVSGVRGVDRTEEGVVAELNGVARQDVVRELVGAGVGVQRVTPRRKLEDVFLTLVGGGDRVVEGDK